MPQPLHHSAFGVRRRLVASALGLVLLCAGASPGLADGSDEAARSELPLPLMRVASKPRLPEFVFQVRAPGGELSERGFVEFRGKPLIATAWATWCGVCRREMPKLDRLAKELEPAGLRVLALSIDEGGMAAAERALAERGLANLRPVHDTDKMFFVSVGAWGVPTTVIADAEGRIVARANGPVAWDDPAVQALLEELLAAPRVGPGRPPEGERPLAGRHRSRPRKTARPPLAVSTNAECGPQLIPVACAGTS